MPGFNRYRRVQSITAAIAAMTLSSMKVTFAIGRLKTVPTAVQVGLVLCNCFHCRVSHRDMSTRRSFMLKLNSATHKLNDVLDRKELLNCDANVDESVDAAGLEPSRCCP